jgi:hypothetical protein
MSSMPSQPKDASPWMKKLMNANWSGRLMLILIFASTVIGFFSGFLFCSCCGFSYEVWGSQSTFGR